MQAVFPTGKAYNKIGLINVNYIIFDSKIAACIDSSSPSILLSLEIEVYVWTAYKATFHFDGTSMWKSNTA